MLVFCRVRTKREEVGTKTKVKRLLYEGARER
jgi:hypothetical protein